MLRYVCGLTFCLPSVRSALRALKDLSLLPPSFLPSCFYFIFSLFPCFCSHHQLSTYCVSGTVLSLESCGDRKINSTSGDCGGLECTEFITRCIRLWDALLQMVKTEPDRECGFVKAEPQARVKNTEKFVSCVEEGAFLAEQTSCLQKQNGEQSSQMSTWAISEMWLLLFPPVPGLCVSLPKS